MLKVINILALRNVSISDTWKRSIHPILRVINVMVLRVINISNSDQYLIYTCNFFVKSSNNAINDLHCLLVVNVLDPL